MAAELVPARLRGPSRSRVDEHPRAAVRAHRSERAARHRAARAGSRHDAARSLRRWRRCFPATVDASHIAAVSRDDTGLVPLCSWFVRRGDDALESRRPWPTSIRQIEFLARSIVNRLEDRGLVEFGDAEIGIDVVTRRSRTTSPRTTPSKPRRASGWRNRSARASRPRSKSTEAMKQRVGGTELSRRRVRW